MESKIFRGLAEAYAEIYSPQEIDEASAKSGRVTGSNPNVWKPTPSTSGPAGGGMGGRRGGGSSPGSLRPAKPAPQAKPAPTPQAKPAPTPQAKPAPTPTARPAASAPKPAAPQAKPAAPQAKPAPTTSGYKKDTSITDMIGRSQVRQGAPINTGNKSSDIRSMAARGSVGATPTTSAAKPSPTTRPMGSRKPGSIVSGLDMFDLVKGHLLDEGYADTEEAAIAIMANMSEEWRESIILGEEQLNELSNRKLRAYIKKSDKSHQDLNKKWDQGTATYQDKYKSINRERGQERAFKKLDKRSGK
jgi:hypothetical protein